MRCVTPDFLLSTGRASHLIESHQTGKFGKILHLKRHCLIHLTYVRRKVFTAPLGIHLPGCWCGERTHTVWVNLHGEGSVLQTKVQWIVNPTALNSGLTPRAVFQANPPQAPVALAPYKGNPGTAEQSPRPSRPRREAVTPLLVPQ